MWTLIYFMVSCLTIALHLLATQTLPLAEFQLYAWFVVVIKSHFTQNIPDTWWQRATSARARSSSRSRRWRWARAAAVASSAWAATGSWATARLLSNHFILDYNPHLGNAPKTLEQEPILLPLDLVNLSILSSTSLCLSSQRHFTLLSRVDFLSSSAYFIAEQQCFMQWNKGQQQCWQ